MQQKIFFENGYGASVIDHGYGREDGLYEVAVLEGEESDWMLCYDTPVTDDVIGRLTPDEVIATLELIQALPRKQLNIPLDGSLRVF